MTFTFERTDAQTIVDYLKREAEEQRLPIHIGAVLKDTLHYVKICARIDREMDAYEKAVLMTDLAETWNAQEPEPDRIVMLTPAAIND